MTQDPVQQPATAPAPAVRARRWAYPVVGLAVLLLAGGLWVAYDRNLVLKDSGLQACEDLRDGRGAVDDATREEQPMTEPQYRELRAVFADSRYRGIRDHGTQLMDVVWQVSQRGEDPAAAGGAAGSLAYLGPLTEHLTGLQSACADHGVQVDLKPA